MYGWTAEVGWVCVVTGPRRERLTGSADRGFPIVLGRDLSDEADVLEALVAWWPSAQVRRVRRFEP